MRPSFLVTALASLAFALSLTTTASAQTGPLYQTNLGPLRPINFTKCQYFFALAASRQMLPIRDE